MDQITNFPIITALKTKRVHARFGYSCSCCGAPIQRGEAHDYIVFTDNETTSTSRLRTARIHLTCPPTNPRS